MDSEAIQSVLAPWGVDFTSEGLAALRQSGARNPTEVRDYVLSADLRRLHLAPHPADSSNFSALHSKSMQAPPEVAAWAAADGPATNFGSPATSYSLKKPLLCMVLSFQDVRLPTKDVEEDFSDGAQGIKGNQRRTLLLRLTDGRGISFKAIELRFCQQLDAVPLLPGVKLLLLPGLVLYRGMALLTPRNINNLAGGAKQLREAFNLKEDVQERRKFVQHILKEHSQLQERIKADKADTGPPKFVPFSFSAKVQHVELSAGASKVLQPQTPAQPREEFKREAVSPTQPPEETPSEQQPRSLLIKPETADLKRDRLRQLEKVDPNSLGAGKAISERKKGRGGSGRRGRRERDEDLADYIKPSGGPVTCSLFDLIRADAEQTNSTAATALLCASEPYVNSNLNETAAPQPSPGIGRQVNSGARSGSTNFDECPSWSSEVQHSRGRSRGGVFTTRGGRAGGRWRGRAGGGGRPSR
ncbi:hypothetical protein, conserved [Eimeria acervulina]|uniref:RecQ mediated genome instability protein 1 OB-fold domain-containing protein n=1 Tax=Eimeria acervulina TaxID=5801 RepID=U6GAS5_EIMAC|nr:hypothetical protein, conserved [Eimeria acervulina]CDI77376.1 hypothetical protein, conserved [Eimeria acervulina]